MRALQFAGPSFFVATVMDWAGLVVAIRTLLWVLREPIRVFPAIAPVEVPGLSSQQGAFGGGTL